MAVNEQLLDRVRELIAPVTSQVEEKRMFSGVCLMVKGKMCVAVSKDRIMVRFDPELTGEVLEKDGTRPMVMSGKSLQGYVYVDESALGTKKQLGYWVGLALDYNKFAKSSKKGTRKAPKKADAGKKNAAGKMAKTAGKKKAAPKTGGGKKAPARKSR